MLFCANACLAIRSACCNEQHDVYRFIHRLAELRGNRIALRRGRQYLRQISADGTAFYYSQPLGGTALGGSRVTTVSGSRDSVRDEHDRS
jgi:hypothetical protein